MQEKISLTFFLIVNKYIKNKRIKNRIKHLVLFVQQSQWMIKCWSNCSWSLWFVLCKNNCEQTWNLKEWLIELRCYFSAIGWKCISVGSRIASWSCKMARKFYGNGVYHVNGHSSIPAVSNMIAQCLWQAKYEVVIVGKEEELVHWVATRRKVVWPLWVKSALLLWVDPIPYSSVSSWVVSLKSSIVESSF